MKIKRVFIVAGYLLFLVFLLEIWARGYYALERKTPFFASGDKLVYNWYPELKRLDGYDEGKFNVLLLGGSALTEEWGSVPQHIEEKLKAITEKDINIINMAHPAHGTLDSLYKYRRLKDKVFDIVIFYHGINEVRANNVPPELWKDDYSHYSWYEEVNFYFNHPGLRKTGMLLPYFVKHLLVQLQREVVARDRYVPTHSPREDWVKYGADIKTEKTFRENLRKISKIARGKNELLVVATYAYDPGPGSTELWGSPENVKKGIDTHNSVIKEILQKEGFVFVDQKKLTDSDKRYFTDICHFSDEGSAFFAGNIVGKIKTLINTDFITDTHG